MSEVYVFQPDRRWGVAFHLVAILVLGAAGVAGLWQAAGATIGPAFLLFLLPGLVAVILVPALAYRLYALQNSAYTLERDGIRLRWGLRVEEIPIGNILWVHPAAGLAAPLPLPRLRWPGAVLGRRRLSSDEDVEFMASTSRGLMLIATAGRGYAISPSDPQGFLLAFQRCTEMGSLVRLPARSIYPTFLLNRVWSSRLARGLLLGGAALNLVLLVWVSLTIPTRSEVTLGFRVDGQPGYAVPAVRLLLLPVLNSFFFLVDVFLGFFFYRREDSQPFSYLLWSSGALLSILFLTAVFFILRSG
jgi:hypothetical protein